MQIKSYIFLCSCVVVLWGPPAEVAYLSLITCTSFVISLCSLSQQEHKSRACKMTVGWESVGLKM